MLISSPVRAESVSVFAREPASTHGYRIPAFVVTRKGTLLAFCERRIGLHDHAENDIVLRRSTDGGKSWHPIQIIADDGGDSLNDPCAVVLQTGRVLLRYKRYPKGVHQRKSGHTVMAEPGYGGPKNVRVYLTHSDDDGVTWSPRREVTRVMRRESSISVGSPGNAIQLTRGPHRDRIVFANYEGVRLSETERTFRNSVSYSDDGGTTWKLSEPIDDSPIAPRTGNEAQVVELADGSMLLSARVTASVGRKLVRSADGGATWKNLRIDLSLETPACMSSVLRYSWPEGDRPGLLLHSLPNTKRSRSNGTLFASRDDGKNWKKLLTIEPDGFAYSCLARLPNGDVGCLYETGSGAGFRIVFKRIAAASVGGSASSSSTSSPPEEEARRDARSRRPNILLITSEDHSPDIGCYGDKVIATPRLDRLAAEGVRFSRAYVPYSVCSPSRASLLTGLYPHQNGQIGLATHKMAMFRAWPNMVSLLRGAGYRTGMIGKLHVNPASAFPLDFHEYAGSNFRDRPVRRFADRAEAFMRDAAETPFFLMVNYPDAHIPLLDRQHGLPERPLRAAEVTTPAYIGVDTPRLRVAVAKYYNCLLRLDAGIGMLLDALARTGKEKQTLVIWLSDHGTPFARGKTTVYEAGLRVPLIVRWPGVARRGAVEDRFASSLDLLPTIIAAAGIAAPAYALPGRSLLPLLRGDSVSDWRRYVVGVHEGSWSQTYLPQRSIRDEQYKLIVNLLPDRENQLCTWYYMKEHRTRCPTPEELASASENVRDGYATWAEHPPFELYDLEKDPHEFTNLANREPFAGVKARLMDAYREWQKRTGDPFSDPELLARLTREFDDLVDQYGGTTSYRKDPAFRWDYLDYLAPSPENWRSERGR